ncbi:trehalose phosphatase/synthase 11, TREHALOSE-6-PHOSPHATE SYNTHASE 11 [Hibiscus trionum]|uniref:Trehalose phosphatase/synthase 11, TREHALOSE-6-PHOSPHATE SYNTHASE 11 n=1 Tax=Hibiscus trionum TaxID=183268 RepID=A0A9W7M5W4_HIBTR|nr:trehalose phosphatase/synthase 11, TREHALOSE-6-PHOSPHATE SYNTHASE 11 [Hibiscus trionum]
MVSSCCLDQFNMLSTDDFRVMNRIPRVMKVPGVVSEFEDDDQQSVRRKRVIVVSNQLPLRAWRDSVSGEWCFEFDENELLAQLKDAFPPDTEVRYVGTLRADVDAADQDAVAQVLRDKLSCETIFLPVEMRNLFYHGFCKHYLWPLFHYMMPMPGTDGVRFDRAQWAAYVSANKIFADKVLEVMFRDDEDGDHVWVHDYHLMALPTFLRRRCNRVKLGFFLHSPFPSSDIYKTLPVRDDILRALLNCDLIGFHTFDYARHFLSCCRRILGLHSESNRGHIALEYYGRPVTIKILPAGIHMGQLGSVIAEENTLRMVKELKDRFQGRILMIGVDDLDTFKGIPQKFSAIGELLDRNHELRGKVVLVQITNPARSLGRDVQLLLDEANGIAKEVNAKYGKPGYEPIVFMKGPITTREKLAYYAVAEYCVVTPVRDGMNLVPYKYTVCRQGCPALDKALGVDENSPPKNSVIIVSEFIGCSPSLSGAIRVNPWDITEMATAMCTAITLPDTEKHLRHEKHYKYISSHDVSYWARSFDQDLVRACRDHYHKRYWRVGLGFAFRLVAMEPNFRKLLGDTLNSAYRITNSRLILLDYDGTMMPPASVNKGPSHEVISVLNRLCSDPKNIVFIVSGRDRGTLSKWFSSCEKLGIAAEHGYFIRWTRDSPWETSHSMDLSWKEVVEPIMQLYTETTDGSCIENKETAVVWHYQDADPDFGLWQAKELHDHLESVLANDPVVVKTGEHIVEVKPQGVSKGIVVENVISSMRSKGKAPDFLLCIGDDRSDEDMFESIARSSADPILPTIAEVFACTVGLKPSRAKYYVDDIVDVIGLLRGVPEASVLPN